VCKLGTENGRGENSGMSKIKKCCGTCARWKPAIKRKLSNSEFTATDAGCPWYNYKMAESKPESWCWLKATPEQVKSRVKAGLIEE
jgi:hypothetical protein